MFQYSHNIYFLEEKSTHLDMEVLSVYRVSTSFKPKIHKDFFNKSSCVKLF